MDESQLVKRFLDYYNSWHNPLSEKEFNYIRTASIISQYVNSIKTIKDVKTDLNSSHPEYKKLGGHKQRSFGALLYARFIVQDLIALSEKDRPLLRELSDSLGELYLNPRSNTQKNIKRLIHLTNEWLNGYAEALYHKERAKEFFHAIYTLLHLVLLSLHSLKSFNLAVVLFAKLLGVDAIKNEVSNLLNLTETHCKKLYDRVQMTDSSPEIINEKTETNPPSTQHAPTNKEVLEPEQMNYLVI